MEDKLRLDESNGCALNVSRYSLQPMLLLTFDLAPRWPIRVKIYLGSARWEC